MSLVPCVLTIGGSDSSGGAGIQADLKTFVAHQVHGLSVVTGVTAQNTTGVVRTAVMESELVTAQIDAVADDMAIAAGKTGLLFNAVIIEAAVDAVRKHSIENLVVDPVLVDKRDQPIVDEAAVELYRHQLLPLCRLTTPNLREAEILSGVEIDDLNSAQHAAHAIHDIGNSAVLIKGGRWKESPGTDIYFNGTAIEVLSAKTRGLPKAYGTGCTLSASIAANLAKGLDLFESVQSAKEYVGQCLARTQKPGQGQPLLGY